MSCFDTIRKLTYDQFSMLLGDRHPDLSSIIISPQEESYVVDLRPYANLSCVRIGPNSSFTEAYKLFRTLGIRHLTVVGSHNEVLGIITRKDLL